MFEKEEDKYVKERSEEVLENLDGLEKKQKIRKLLVVAIISVLIIIIIFLGVSFYTYFKSPEKTLGIGANIESALLSSDGNLVYVKLLGGSLDKNITKIKFIFNDLDGNAVNETNENGESKVQYIILSLLAVIILIIGVVIVKKKTKKVNRKKHRR